MSITLGVRQPPKPQVAPATTAARIKPAKKKPQNKPVPKPEPLKALEAPAPALRNKVERSTSPTYVAEPNTKLESEPNDVVQFGKTTGNNADQASTVPLVQPARPLYRTNPPPQYPITARRRGLQGNVVLEVLVDRNGNVGDLRIWKSSGYPILDRAAMDSVKKWLFVPGMRGNEKLEMWVRIPIRFELK